MEKLHKCDNCGLLTNQVPTKVQVVNAGGKAEWDICQYCYKVAITGGEYEKDELKTKVDVKTTYGDGSLKKEEEAKKPEKPKNKRVVRTKSTGDRVYLLDEDKKTRQWINSNDPKVPSPELVSKLGFTMGDVVEIDDTEFLKYSMGSPIYKVDGKS